MYWGIFGCSLFVYDCAATLVAAVGIVNGGITLPGVLFWTGLEATLTRMTVVLRRFPCLRLLRLGGLPIILSCFKYV